VFFRSILCVAFAIIPIFFVTCSSTNPNFTDCLADPLFDFKNIKAVGLIPISWTEYGKNRGIDPLQEKMLQFYIAKEFEFMKINSSILSKEKVNIVNDTVQIIDENSKNMDAVIFMYFDQKLDSIWIPSQSSGYFSLNSYFGTGGYSKVDAHQKNLYRMGITVVMLTGKPFYKEKIWEGRLLRTSSDPDLNKCGECLITELFFSQYPGKKKSYDRINCYDSKKY
jgi:hypothetical protein